LDALAAFTMTALPVESHTLADGVTTLEFASHNHPTILPAWFHKVEAVRHTVPLRELHVLNATISTVADGAAEILKNAWIQRPALATVSWNTVVQTVINITTAIHATTMQNAAGVLQLESVPPREPLAPTLELAQNGVES